MGLLYLFTLFVGGAIKMNTGGVEGYVARVFIMIDLVEIAFICLPLYAGFEAVVSPGEESGWGLRNLLENYCICSLGTCCHKRS
jgi:hypothetical protein